MPHHAPDWGWKLGDRPQMVPSNSVLYHKWNPWVSEDIYYYMYLDLAIFAYF